MPAPDAPTCRAILAGWRAHPGFTFDPPYEAFGEPLRQLARQPAATRLVEGIVLRIGRRDPPAEITAWAQSFATRRALTLPVSFPH